MASDSEENFDLDAMSHASGDSDLDSDGYAPKPKVAKGKAVASTKPKATKSIAKSTTTGGSKKRPLKPLENKDVESDAIAEFDDDGGGDESDMGPSKPRPKKNLGPGRNEGKDASDIYQKLSQVEHILQRPDSYVGSVESVTQDMWVFNSETKRLQFKNITYVPAFFKIFDEILVNAADNKINDPNMNIIKVTVDVEKKEISVYNNGKGIPIEMHKKEKIYIPSMIFGQLLTSSNYDDNEKKLTGGRNGYGAKLTNIYSKEFTVETADKGSSQKFKQTWSNNMSRDGVPKITTNPKGEEFTKVTFKPDLERFGMQSIDSETESLLMKRVYDLAGTVDGVTVSLNGERIKVKGFKAYIDMYLTAATEASVEASGGAAVVKPTIIYEQLDDRWEYAFAISESSTFQHVSFANSISTTKGGTHVNLIADQICKKLLVSIEKKNKAVKIKNAQIKNHMWIFVNALIENPTFDSQTKEQLTLTATKFGSKPAVSEEFIKKVMKSDIVDRVLNWAKFKSDQLIAKTDRTKRTRLTGLVKLSDANNAGTKHAKDCTLILTEGDSAKALAESGLGVVGRDNFGVFPLRGKLLNVREATHDQIMKNTEIQNIKKIMGLQHNKDYKDRSSLRYGSLMIMTDQDHDGSHIKGLLINFLEHFYPSLLKLPSFLVEFVTPIVRVTKGNQKKNFFTIPEYLEWNEVHNKDGKWHHKYYKGLGTSTNEEAKEYFGDMAAHMIPFATMKDEDRPLIEMAFSKKKAEERKEWLRKFEPGTFIDHTLDEITYDDFINRELILFSMADNIRSIPSVVDGLKPGQRKILFGCFKRKLKDQIKVAQLVGYISEKTAYQHGEQSLTSSIIALAQDFVGSNNVNLLSPDGQYGTRFNGGKDAASARYIFTHLPKITRSIFHPHDDPILNSLVDDGERIEPEWYVPVLPTVLVNGSDGIGTGWSTAIPSYNPVDIVANIRRIIREEPQIPMVPWYRGFKGTIEKAPGDKEKFIITGTIRQIDDTSVEITELPIRKWTEQYKEFLESCMIGGAAPEKDKDKEKAAKAAKVPERFLQDYKEHHAGRHIHFIVSMSQEQMKNSVKEGLISCFKLSTTMTTSNMMCFDPHGTIKKYNTPEEILEDFYAVRFQYYQKRKAYMVKELENQVDRLNNQARFVQMIIEKKLVVSGRKKADIVIELRTKNFRPFPKILEAKEYGENEEAVEDDATTGSNSDFDYLLGMPIWSLTHEKVEKLRNECKAKEDELEVSVKVTPTQLWDTDLDAFLANWEKVLESDEALERKAGGTTKGKKQATLKTRKSIGKGKKHPKSDDDSDYGGGKASKSAAASKLRPKAQPKVTAYKEESDSHDDFAPPKPKSEDGADFAGDRSSKVASTVAVSKPKAKPKPKASAKKDDSDSDVADVAPKIKEHDDDSEFGGGKPAKSVSGPALKGKAKAKSKVLKHDDSAGQDIKEIAPKAKGKAKPSVKRKSPELIESDSEAEYMKPAPKKMKPTTSTSASVTDFFDNLPPDPMKPKPKPKPVPKAPPKRKKPDSEDDDIDSSMNKDIDSSPPVGTKRRPARAVATNKKWALSSEPEEVGNDTSIFEISD